MKKLKTTTLLLILMLTGCASAKPAVFQNPQIIVYNTPETLVLEEGKESTESGYTARVEFITSGEQEMSYKRGDEEYLFSSKKSSLLSRILSGVAVGATGGRR